jgi:hypothetical protein
MSDFPGRLDDNQGPVSTILDSGLWLTLRTQSRPPMLICPSRLTLEVRTRHIASCWSLKQVVYEKVYKLILPQRQVA